MDRAKEGKKEELTDPVTVAFTGVWREAVKGSCVRNRLWDRQGGILSPAFCSSISQLEEHLQNKTLTSAFIREPI